jgi:methionine-gamma-lyase
MNNKKLGFGSICSHPLHNKSGKINPHVEPIYPTTTYSYDNAQELMEVFKGEREGYIYSRWGNPTFDPVELKIAQLEAWNLTDENGSPLKLKAQLFSSGIAAISALLLAALKPGDKVIAQGTLYGGTNELLMDVLAPLGIQPIITDLKDLNKVESLIKEDNGVRMIYIETPSNPTIDCYDIEALCKLAKHYHLLTAVDNTFATPYLQQPFKYGVDFVAHSTTKYLNGHGNAIGGILLGKDLGFMKGKLFKTLKLIGSNANPFDAWLLSQGIKTLELRMDRHCSNAMKVAEFLNHHPKVAVTNYCGLPSHPDYALAKKQMRDFGGMLSFELKGGLEAGKKLMNEIRFCTLAVSLGTADTIIQHPASMSHLPVPKAVREKYGITDGLIRLSVGIENPEDIIEDLEQALNKI